MGWNYLSIPKLQRCNRWSLGMDKQFHPTFYNGCNYLSMLGLKLNHVSKRGPKCQQTNLELYGEINCCQTTTKHDKAWVVCIIFGMCLLQNNKTTQNRIQLLRFKHTLSACCHFGWELSRTVCKTDTIYHDDVIRWKHFARYWSFVRGIHRSPWIPHT